MISGLVLKYLNGECFVICGFYKYTLLASTEFNLTVPSLVHSAAKVSSEPSLPTFCTAANVCNAAKRNWSGEITMFQHEVKMRASLGGRGKISIAYWD
jgi:hypothetical protein